MPTPRTTITIATLALLALHAPPAARAAAALRVDPPIAPANAIAPSATSTPNADDSPPTIVTRADLAAAYLEVDAAFAAFLRTNPDFSRIQAASRAFDASTLSFFSGDLGRVVAGMQRLRADIDRRPDAPASALALDGIVVSLDRAVWWGDAPSPRLRIASIGAAPAETTLTLRIGLSPRNGGEDPGPPRARQLRLAAGERLRLDLPLWDAVGDHAEELKSRPTRWIINVTIDGFADRARTELSTTTGSLDATRERNTTRLDDLSRSMPIARDPALITDIAICRARNLLLTDSPNPARSAEFLFTGHLLASEVARELDALTNGENPYRDRRGGFYRPVIVDDVAIPARIYVPPQLPPTPPSAPADQPRPWPVVVALHGAGGDESMFMDAYGRGELVRQADRLGFILLTPATTSFAGPTRFDAAIDQLAADYAIDPDRIYVLGHSLGAGVAAGLGASRRDRIAAVACIAGGGRLVGGANQPIERAPTLVIAAELDPIARPEALARSADAARRQGQLVEFRKLEGHGHTLVVGAAIPAVIDWLWTHTRTPAPAPGR